MKIKTFSLTDFRAFPGPAPTTFELDGKSLLVYGENGSGKSSLFHALRGMFSYDTPPNLLNLRNSFSSAGIGSVRVQVVFDDDSVAAWEVGSGQVRGIINSAMVTGPVATVTHPGHHTPVNTQVKEAAKFSAMLDYRSLLATNYKHGDGSINLFELAVNGFLSSYVDLATNQTLGQLWAAVLASKPMRNTSKTLALCVSRCSAFNNALNTALGRLVAEAQTILTALSPNGLTLVALPFQNVNFNNARAWADKGFTNQVIGLEVAFHGLLVDTPQNYLNEARLSALGLALYLGARLACTPQTTSHLKLLVLDDVLVGLDHSNRLPVLNVLKDHFPDWQIVLLTHDRGWFDLARQHLPSGWTCYEVYEGDQGAPAPMPIVRKTLKRSAPALLQKARELLAQGYVEAAANYVRQAFETGLRAACELKSVKLSYKQDLTDHKAQDLLNGLKTWPGSPTVPKANWDAALHQLELMKDVVMNPYSHPSAPNIPRQEIVDAVDAVEKFLALARKK